LPNLESEFQQQFAQTEKLQKTWNEWQIELNKVQEKQQRLQINAINTNSKMKSLESSLKPNV
jgi:predicted  nucleic acid-binding Zn-ribbon protein